MGTVALSIPEGDIFSTIEENKANIKATTKPPGERMKTTQKEEIN